MKKILTSILCMLCLFSASMSAFEYKGINYSVVSSTDQTVTVAAPNAVSGEITIPKLVMDAATSTAYRVVSISDNAFKDCAELTSVTFKAELTSIGKSAFENTGLTSIVIPEAITIINESTFSGCASLAGVILSSGTTSIGKSAFANSGLTSIEIPEAVTTINESTFSGCASLTSITLPSGTTSVDKSAFANSGLTSIVIPEGVTTINESTFSGCANLTSISLPSKLGSIGNNAFMNSGITSLDLTRSTKSIGDSAFEGCTSLKTVNYTYNRSTIGNDAFKGCTALEDLNLVLDNSLDYVDLGLPSGTLWADRNVGADSPEDYGDYFAWGETEPKTDNAYSWSSYKWYNGSNNSLTKYCTSSDCGTVDNKTELDSEDDAATVNWGSQWQMPSSSQIAELIKYTSHSCTVKNGVNGVIVTSRTNGNSIFLPGNGYVLCWSRTLRKSDNWCAYFFIIDDEIFDYDAYDRCDVLPVRPVRVAQ